MNPSFAQNNSSLCLASFNDFTALLPMCFDWFLILRFADWRQERPTDHWLHYWRQLYRPWRLARPVCYSRPTYAVSRSGPDYPVRSACCS